MTVNAVVRCASCNHIVRKSQTFQDECPQCREIIRMKDEIKHLKHKNKTLRRSNLSLKAIVERLKKFEPKQTFYDTGEGYK